jgi:tetratricopeptide (TPR) repeat protein
MIGITLMSRHATAGAIVLGLALASAGTVPAFAAGGDGGGGGGSSGGTVQCKEGMVYNEAKKICEQASLLEDKDLIKQGRALALAGYYENALDALMAVRDKDDATALTYIGYAKRKMGDVDEGIAYYHQALAIDPDNLDTHEYLGEGYVAAGRTDLAEMQLARLETLCGSDCTQYAGLAAAIAGEPEHWGNR